MPRNARKKSETGIYHVVVRGINRQMIFHDEEDYQRYLETLARIKKVSDCEIYGYCLMGNHVHLLIKENEEPIGVVMKRLGTSYAYWYNSKYEHIGHVFQDRYKSECVEEDAYLMVVIRYIHNNPVKAGIEKKPEDYRWSSCQVYYGGKEYPQHLTKVDLVLGMFSDDAETSKKLFREFMEQDNSDNCLEDEKRKRASDKEVREAIQILLQGESIDKLKEMEKEKRDSILSKMKEIEGSSIRQIARITGIGYNIIIRA
ncbi:MAG TPA: transposase [Syntrophomonadaceae bacterium]|jgi:putative transposase|nr:transposase [Syntrophomonadaceae bacterium]HQD90508.1 transposase [Syntrophomonadaceae bacterium]